LHDNDFFDDEDERNGDGRNVRRRVDDFEHLARFEDI
jgi:hypothetical protein